MEGRVGWNTGKKGLICDALDKEVMLVLKLGLCILSNEEMKVLL